ncbi:hypothetical protein LCGC14_0393260 [marine sediment metagenome]|uniref:Uncharacterized protein n=1 Tax=marine sediment metagenome TaxID=412755 RepID=A0A0F9SZ51_9ZZZZ
MKDLLTPKERDDAVGKAIDEGSILTYPSQEDREDIILKAQHAKDMEEHSSPKCGVCGGEMSKNPHPKAGKPLHYLEAGTVHVCIPCTFKGRHNWAERAMKAEGLLARLDSKREKIDNIFKQEFKVKEGYCPHCTDRLLDQIIALLKGDS